MDVRLHQLVRFPVASEPFFFRVPFQRAFQPVGNIGQATNRTGAVPRLCITDRRFAAFDGIQPILVMIIAIVQVCFIGLYDGCSNIVWLAVNERPADIQTAFGANEPDTKASAKVFMFNDYAIIIDHGECFVILAIRRVKPHRAAPVFVQRPLNKVKHMSAPDAKDAATIFFVGTQAGKYIFL